MMNGMIEHLSEGAVAAYADNRLKGEERRSVEAHLAECAPCREEVVEVTRLIRSDKRRAIRPWLPLAAAASIAVVAIGVTLQQRTPRAPVLRSGETHAVVESTSPADNAHVSAPVAFSWRRLPEALEYRVTITNSSGDVVAERMTSDSAATVPRLTRDQYRWYVTAIMQDGTVLSSRTRALVVD